MDWLKERKTYIVAAIGAVIQFCATVEWITQDVANDLLKFVGLLFAVTFRMAMASKAADDKKAMDQQTAVLKTQTVAIEEQTAATEQQTDAIEDLPQKKK